jgi:hypothetical protein
VVATLAVLLVVVIVAGPLVALLQLVRNQRRAAVMTARWVAGAAMLPRTADGRGEMTTDKILDEHPDLQPEDVPAALHHAAEALADTTTSSARPREAPGRREPVAEDLHLPSTAGYGAEHDAVVSAARAISSHFLARTSSIAQQLSEEPRVASGR